MSVGERRESEGRGEGGLLFIVVNSNNTGEGKKNTEKDIQGG